MMVHNSLDNLVNTFTGIFEEGVKRFSQAEQSNRKMNCPGGES